MAIVVISDCSPIRALHHLGLLWLCKSLYGSVVVPIAVRDELHGATATCPPINIETYPEFSVEVPRSQPGPLGVPSDLDNGETQAIVLAIELHADLLLMDERKGTAVARRLGLTTIGVFGVLLEAKRAKLIDAVLPLVDRLMADLGFFVSSTLRERLAKLAEE